MFGGERGRGRARGMFGGERGRGRGRAGRIRARSDDGANLVVPSPGKADTAADAPPADAPAVVPNDDEIDGSTTLAQLRTHEAAIMAASRAHEDALKALTTRYQRVRAKMYRDHKKAVIAEDNAKLGRFQRGCAKLKPRPTKEELDAQAKCLQKEALEVDESDLGRLLRRHLWAQPPPPAGKCEAFRGLELDQLRPAVQSCLRTLGEAKWTQDGLVDLNASRAACGRKWLGPAEARCLLAGKDVLFMGNSVVRRQMYTLLDLLAGPRAHRQLRDFSSVQLPDPNVDVEKVKRSWVWDRDNETFAYHGAQLVTVDLTTGEHRFTMPHVSCGLGDKYQVFNPGRLNQWRNPGSGGGTEEIGANWKSSKWFSREWRPVVSMELELPPPGRGADLCAARQVALAGASDDGVAAWPPSPPPTDVLAERRRRPRRRAGVGAAIRDRLIQEVRAHFADKAADVDGWLMNVSVHVETGGLRGAAAGGAPRRRRGEAANPNVWVYFPTYHGEREHFNGFCEDKVGTREPCVCTQKLASCHKHPECRGRHECLPLPQTSGVWVDRARSFAASLRAKGKVLSYAAARVATTPFYDDCWDNRGRCQGMRPCREPVDHMHTCRATAMFCRGAGADGWASELTKAKAWIPSGRPTASLLYMFDGQAEALQTETFRTWGPASVGYGAHALVFGPQFGKFHGHAEWKHKLAVVRGALRRADACLGRKTLVLFRSPAFNFDPMNTPAQQAAFSAQMRPLVEEAGFVYVDNYAATYEAVFQETPHAIKFAMNSAFHYLNAGRYLMAQLVLGAFQLLAPSS